MFSSDERDSGLHDFLNDLTIRGNILHGGQTIKIISQNPSEAPKHCPICGKQMLDHKIGGNSIVRYFVRSCPHHPHEGWNTSRYHGQET
jgi:hypothetical protein